MTKNIFKTLIVALSVVSVLGSSCSNPKTTVTSFSTQDATYLTQLAHIAEIQLKCDNPVVPNLFAEFPCGKIVPAAQVGENLYQLSWTEEIKKSSGATFTVRLFDEEGYASIRRAQRDGDKAANVQSLVDVVVTTKSAYKGPWVKAEVVAAIVVSGLAYFAYNAKSKIEA